MRESRTYGFVRGVPGDRHPYRDSQTLSDEPSLPCSSRPVDTGAAQPRGLAAFTTMLPSPLVGVSDTAPARNPRYGLKQPYVSVSRFWDPR